jgi:uncharacterized membrane protein
MTGGWLTTKMLGGALLCSVALNLFLGGMLISRIKSAHQAGAEPKIERMIERMAASVSESDGQVLRTVFRSHQAEIAQRVAALRDAREEARKAFGAEPFNETGLEAAFAQQRQRRQAVHEAIHGVLVEAAPRLSAEGRRKLGDWRRDSR